MVESLTDNPERFLPGSQLLLEGQTGALRVAKSRVHKGRLLVRFEGVEDRDSAERLRNLELRVPLTKVPPAPEGAYYHFALVGCAVMDRKLGELGVVTAVVEDGGGLMLEVEGAALEGSALGGSSLEAEDPKAQHHSLLVPFVRAFLVDVVVDQKRIEVDLPEGLVDLCVSTS